MREKIEELLSRAEAVRDHPWDTEHDVVSAIRQHFKELADIVASMLKGPEGPGENEPRSQGPATPGQAQAEKAEESAEQV